MIGATSPSHSLARWKSPAKWGKILKVRESLFTTVVYLEHNQTFKIRGVSGA